MDKLIHKRTLPNLFGEEEPYRAQRLLWCQACKAFTSHYVELVKVEEIDNEFYVLMLQVCHHRDKKGLHCNYRREHVLNARDWNSLVLNLYL